MYSDIPTSVPTPFEGAGWSGGGVVNRLLMGRRKRRWLDLFPVSKGMTAAGYSH